MTIHSFLQLHRQDAVLAAGAMADALGAIARLRDQARRLGKSSPPITPVADQLSRIADKITSACAAIPDAFWAEVLLFNPSTLPSLSDQSNPSNWSDKSDSPAPATAPAPSTATPVEALR